MVDEDRLRREITDLLAALRAGDRSAMDRLMPLVYDELRRRAHQQLARVGSRGALSTTALVNEAYLRLAHTPDAAWEDRHHFFAVAVKAMRSVVVDYARRHLAQKRGGSVHQVSLDDSLLRVEQDASEILAIHQALDRLGTLDSRLCELVELRFFGGLSVEETAGVLGVSERTVKRDWSKARTLLFGMLQGVPSSNRIRTASAVPILPLRKARRTGARTSRPLRKPTAFQPV